MVKVQFQVMMIVQRSMFTTYCESPRTHDEMGSPDEPREIDDPLATIIQPKGIGEERL